MFVAQRSMIIFTLETQGQLSFDMLKRYLEVIGYKVKYVTNITDVDDKIINRAIDEGKTEKEIAEYFTQETKNYFRN